MDNETQLKKLHEKLLELLSEFDRVCKKYNIRYFLDSGTALGAVRHGGFIPWDDDADVGMLRSEYEKFLKVAPAELLGKFVIQERLNDSLYFKHHAKLRMLGTFFPEANTEKFKYQGIFIDIFPFDYISNYSLCHKIDYFFIRYFRSRTRLRRFKDSRDSLYRKILGLFLDMIPESFLEKLYVWSESRHKKGKMLTCYEYWVCEKKLKFFDAKWLEQSCPISFEGKNFSIMTDWDAYLTKMYGKYMVLPAEDKRVYHSEGVILFG